MDRGAVVMAWSVASPPRVSCRRLLLAVVVLVAGAVSSCSESNAPVGPDDEAGRTGAAGSPVMIQAPTAARQAIGKLVRVEGIAQNAKLSAVVVSGDLLVYCLGRERWPKDVAGKRVMVQGVLEYTDEFTATVSPAGEISQGTGEAIFALRTSEYRLARP